VPPGEAAVRIRRLPCRVASRTSRSSGEPSPSLAPPKLGQ
jgi:hypothetical protein